MSGWPQHRRSRPTGTPPKLGWNRSGVTQEHKKPAVTLKRCKIRARLLWRTNKKSHTRFRFVPTLMTLDDGDLERLIRTLAEKMRFTEPTSISAVYCRSVILVARDIRYTRIFAGVPRGGGVKRQWGCRRRHYLGISVATSSKTLERRLALSAVCRQRSTRNLKKAVL